MAGVLLALVELAVVLRGGGRTLMSGLGEAVQYLAASFAIAICIAFALWAIGSWVARWAGAIGEHKGESTRAEQAMGTIAGTVAAAVATWMLWGLTEEASFRGPGARAAIVLVVAPLMGFFIGWAITRITAKVRQDGSALVWAILSGLALPVFMILDAFWVPNLYPEIHLGLSLGAACSAVLFAACLPPITPGGRTYRAGLVATFVLILLGLWSISALRKEPARLAAVEQHAPVTGKVIRALTRRPNE